MKNNKLIAKFMGFVYPMLKDIIVINNEVIDVKDLQYHTSWDWLMPVVEKIRETTSVDISFLSSDYENNNTVMVKIKSINCCITNTNGKTAIYKAVVEFIKVHI